MTLLIIVVIRKELLPIVQIKAVVVNSGLEVTAETHVHFDSMLPEYRSIFPSIFHRPNILIVVSIMLTMMVLNQQILKVFSFAGLQEEFTQQDEL